MHSQQPETKRRSAEQPLFTNRTNFACATPNFRTEMASSRLLSSDPLPNRKNFNEYEELSVSALSFVNDTSSPTQQRTNFYQLSAPMSAPVIRTKKRTSAQFSFGSAEDMEVDSESISQEQVSSTMSYVIQKRSRRNLNDSFDSMDEVFNEVNDGFEVKAGPTLFHSRSQESIPDSPNSEFAIRTTGSHLAALNGKTALSLFKRPASMGDIEQSPDFLKVNYSLPVVPNSKCKVQSIAFRHISRETLMFEIERHGDNFRNFYHLIDCRYTYEYEGGHIKYAINMQNPQDLKRFLFPEDSGAFEAVRRRIPIFYCEYSEIRGPRMAHALRRIDRNHNMDHYPNVYYPEMYVLHSGYSHFYGRAEEVIPPKTRELCVPKSYVAMCHPSYVTTLSHERNKGRSSSVLLRAHSAQLNARRTASSADLSHPKLQFEDQSDDAVFSTLRSASEMHLQFE